MVYKCLLRRFAGHSLKFYRHLTMNYNLPLNFIAGKRVFPTDFHCQLKNIHPATGAVLNTFLCSGAGEVNTAVKSSKNALHSWSKKCGRERGKYLLEAAQRVRNRLEDIAHIEVSDTGKPIWEARVDIAGCADVLEYYGGIAATISGSHQSLPDGNFAIIQREPLGVVAGIGAWNYPFQVMTWKLAPALVCGNTFVYKPSEFTPFTSVILAEILSECGVPDGVVNVVQGDSITGAALCSHPDVAKVTFTGSVSTGQKIMKSCAEGMKKVTLELGGKSALLVFADCDIVNAVKATLLGNFLTQGEVCTNCTRVFVEKSILDEFEEKLVSATKNLTIGDPSKNDTLVGAIINESHGQKILKYISLAKKEGATVVCGGEKVVPDEDHLKGFFISPCVLTNCSDEMTVVKEEIFGPVVCILPFETEDEAVNRANSSPYGLGAGVMTKDMQRAHRVASQLQAGIVWINNYNVFHPELPFGGYKMSGFGRENGLAAINDFTQLKTVYVEMNDKIDCPLYT